MKPLAGPLCWIASIQYFIVQIIVARAWQVAYSLGRNPISDLGNTVCGDYGARYVCSPLHGWMNLSFIVLGITMIAGSVLIYQAYRQSATGFGLMALAGLGTLLVGAFPENTVAVWHELGAALPFLLGNLALVILGLRLAMPRPLRLYTIASGCIALLALVLFLSHHYLGLGIGGMERLVAYPQTLWLIIFGLYALIYNKTAYRSTGDS